ncbi:hypothetical protein [Streptomyces sp. NPDC087294]|uniref:hypothetical protein n=1 Tax=Streptomyces sp. NPDC087294 TaxID=3365777 RepID=UPI0037F54939
MYRTVRSSTPPESATSRTTLVTYLARRLRAAVRRPKPPTHQDCGSRIQPLQPAALTAADYTDDELLAVREQVTDVLHAIRVQAIQRSPGGSWKPISTDPLEQLAEATQILDDLSRPITRARKSLGAIDASARDRLYRRVIPQPRQP